MKQTMKTYLMMSLLSLAILIGLCGGAFSLQDISSPAANIMLASTLFIGGLCTVFAAKAIDCKQALEATQNNNM